MEENPLGLPLGQDNLPHQLWLTRPDATRRTNLCTLVLEYLATTEGTFYFNSLHQPHQVVAILIIEEDDTTHARMDQFIRAHLENRHMALYGSIYRNDNAEIVFQEMRLGIITNFITHWASIGCPERLGPPAGLELARAAGGAAPAAREPAGQYDQALLFRKNAGGGYEECQTISAVWPPLGSNNREVRPMEG